MAQGEDTCMIDGLLAPERLWKPKEVWDTCREEFVLVPPAMPPKEYPLARCPEFEANRLPVWCRALAVQFLTFWQRHQHPWPGTLRDQPLKWVEAMQHWEQLARVNGCLDTPMDVLAMHVLSGGKSG